MTRKRDFEIGREVLLERSAENKYGNFSQRTNKK
jgi:hypothetical protein